MSKIAVFPGSFDPITIGHYDVVIRALPLFDKIIIAIGVNSEKKYMFDLNTRLHQLQKVFGDFQNIEIKQFNGLTVDFCQQQNAKFIVRGIRTSSDFEFERGISALNMTLNNQVDTCFFISKPEYSAISSTIVREIIRNGGNAKPFLPKAFEL